MPKAKMLETEMFPHNQGSGVRQLSWTLYHGHTTRPSLLRLPSIVS